jgi:hypothetical protein
VSSARRSRKDAGIGVSLALVALVGLGLAAASGLPALADERAFHDPSVGPKDGVDTIIRTKLPYWRVGDIDKKMSRLCSLGKFNQRVPYLYSARFLGPKGSSLVGGTKGTGLNLRDPLGKADHKKDYWFYRDNTSDCMVLSAKVKPQNANSPTPLATTTVPPAAQTASGR